MNDQSMVVLRNFNPSEDQALIYASWRNALWFSEAREENSSAKFYAIATRRIRKLLANPDIKIKIACLSEMKDFIVGYSLMDHQHLHWVYVKADYRDKGIGKLLTKGFKTIAVPGTKIGRAITLKKNLEIKE